MALLRLRGATNPEGVSVWPSAVLERSCGAIEAILEPLTDGWEGKGDKAAPERSIIGSSEGARIFSNSAARALVKSKLAASGPGT